MKCVKCGIENPDNVRFCGNCGLNNQSIIPNQLSNKNRKKVK